MRIIAYLYAGIAVKKKVSVSIDKKVYEKAHSLGINVSKVSENALLAIIEAIEQANGTKQVFNHALPVVAGPVGFEPTVSGSEGLGGKAFWASFRGFLRDKKYSRRNAAEIFSYSQQYGEHLFKRDFSGLQSLSDGLRPHVLKALSALSKFMGCYADFRRLVADNGLRWKGKSADDLVIDRLTKVQNPDEIFSWIRDLKTKLTGLSLFADFMAVSGLRFIEAVHSYNLIIKLKASGTLPLDRDGQNYRSGYFNRELSSLEHFWFRDLFLRPTKKAFVSFVPKQLIGEIAEEKPFRNCGQIQKLVQSAGLHSRFGDVRENHGTFMTRFLKMPEIDFLHGRVNTSVFMSNYFNPALIGDLQTRVFKGIAEIQEKITVDTG